MRKKIKLSFEALEKELSKISANQMLNVMGGTGITGNLSSQFNSYGSSLDSKINSLKNNTNLSLAQAEYLSELIQMKNEFQSVVDFSINNSVSFNSATNMSGSLESTANLGPNGAHVTIGINLNGSLDTSKFAHEIKHINQAINGELGVSFSANTTSQGEYDKGDEMAAYRREAILKHGADFFDKTIRNRKTEWEIDGVWTEVRQDMTNEEYYMMQYKKIVSVNYSDIPDGNFNNITSYPPTTPYDGGYPTTPYEGDYITTAYDV